LLSGKRVAEAIITTLANAPPNTQAAPAPQ
jgi:hypothetical protein